MIPLWLQSWYRSCDTGISSKTIARVLTGEFCENPNAPHDPSDVGRCVRLLDLAEENGEDRRSRLVEVAEKVPVWAPLVPRWAEIEAAFREQERAETALADAARKRWPATWRKRVTWPPSYCWWLVSTLRGHGDPYKGREVPWER